MLEVRTIIHSFIKLAALSCLRGKESINRDVGPREIMLWLRLDRIPGEAVRPQKGTGVVWAQDASISWIKEEDRKDSV